MPQNRLAEIYVCSEENYQTVICTQIIVYLSEIYTLFGCMEVERNARADLRLHGF
jgi:hypothetical protein